MWTGLQILRSVVGVLVIVLGLTVFARDCVARIREGKRTFPNWNAFVLLKNQGVGWGFWFGMMATAVGVLTLPT